MMVHQNDIAQMRYILNLPLPVEARMFMEHIGRLGQRAPQVQQAPPVQVDRFNDLMSGGDGWIDADRYFAGPTPGQPKPTMLTDERHGGGGGDIDHVAFGQMTGLLLED